MTDDRPEQTTTILTRLLTNLLSLLQSYAELAGQEVRATVRDVAVSVILLLGAFLMGSLAVTMLVVTGILALAIVVPAWASALIVTGVTVLVTAAFIAIGLGRLRTRRLRKVVEAFKEDMGWLRRELLGKS